LEWRVAILGISKTSPLAADISRDDVAFRAYGREAAIYVQASRLKNCREHPTVFFELPAAK
jgi:hypothetical protein